jgi:hypothetical protein
LGVLALPQSLDDEDEDKEAEEELIEFLEAGAGSSRIQKLLDHPGVVGRYITGALSQLQPGRAQAMAGDKVAAPRFYQYFLNLGELPIRTSRFTDKLESSTPSSTDVSRCQFPRNAAKRSFSDE